MTFSPLTNELAFHYLKEARSLKKGKNTTNEVLSLFHKTLDLNPKYSKVWEGWSKLLRELGLESDAIDADNKTPKLISTK